ncbi:hypothetical protein H0H81_007058 [Sphagnurus paluster]|uniref:WW domain-containing protein n=1 Tax=Sphagnurus paluster TaxID=117069 RepID=A0A9P7FQZ9_9AGAR|nr:hypothetical protein H0H81_007058 [Sphagnurus paluster]
MYSCDETKLHNEIEQPVVCTLSQPAVTPSITYSKASSDDISVDVRPPSPSIISDDGADAEPDYIHTRPSPSGDSSTLGSRKGKGDDMTSQLFQISNSSRVSVIPGADILHHGGDLARFRSNQSDSDAVSDFIYPILLKDTLRYKRERKIDTKDVKFELKPYQKLSLGHLPSGWKQFAHPEGQPYFYHAEKRIVTENWLWDEDEMKILNKFIFEIEEFVRTRRLEQPPDTHLFLEWREDSEGQHWCGYYYACASTRSLFWLETHDISGDLDEIKGEISPTHIREPQFLL